MQYEDLPENYRKQLESEKYENILINYIISESLLRASNLEDFKKLALTSLLHIRQEIDMARYTINKKTNAKSFVLPEIEVIVPKNTMDSEILNLFEQRIFSIIYQRPISMFEINLNEPVVKEPINHHPLEIKNASYKLNCWEYKQCGHEQGGKNAHLGICPAATYYHANGFLDGINGGRACMYITGTFCDNSLSGTAKEKDKVCLECEFFRTLKQEHGKDMLVFTFHDYVTKQKSNQYSGSEGSGKKN